MNASTSLIGNALVSITVTRQSSHSTSGSVSAGIGDRLRLRILC